MLCRNSPTSCLAFIPRPSPSLAAAFQRYRARAQTFPPAFAINCVLQYARIRTYITSSSLRTEDREKERRISNGSSSNSSTETVSSLEHLS